MERKKLITLPKLKKKAWKLVSLYVRAGNQDVYNFCYTCNEPNFIKHLDCEHFIHNKLDFDLDNLKPQCSRCNRWLHGNLGIYAQRLIKENGEEWLERLYAKARLKGNNYSRQEINQIIEKYGKNNNSSKS